MKVLRFCSVARYRVNAGLDFEQQLVGIEVPPSSGSRAAGRLVGRRSCEGLAEASSSNHAAWSLASGRSIGPPLGLTGAWLM